MMRRLDVRWDGPEDKTALHCLKWFWEGAGEGCTALFTNSRSLQCVSALWTAAGRVRPNGIADSLLF